MKKIEEYVENTYKLIESSSKLGLTYAGVITGGIAANSYFPKECRRYSNDIDILLQESEVPQNFKGPFIHKSGSKFYYDILDRNNELYIFLIIEDIEAEKYPLEEMKTFNEYFSEKGSSFQGRRLKTHELLKTKLEWMTSRFRGAEAVKDAYDIPLLVRNMDDEIIKEVIENFGDYSQRIFSYFITMDKFRDAIQRKIQPLIASGEFPWEIYEKEVKRLERFVETYSPEDIIFSASILALSRKETKKIMEKIGIKSDRTKDLVKILSRELEKIDYNKKSRMAEKIIAYGKTAVLESLYEIFDS